MSETLFPSIQPQASENALASEPYKEIKWDFINNAPVFRNGAPVIIEGGEAVLVWAWKALHTPRFRHEIYTWDYGNEAEALIGRTLTDELKRAEASRYMRDCLMINPYILDVTDIAVAFDDGRLNVSCKIITVYGEVTIDV